MTVVLICLSAPSIADTPGSPFGVSVRPGEIQLTGVISSPDPIGDRFSISVQQVQEARGRATTLSPPREKTVIIGPHTKLTLISNNTGRVTSELNKGDTILVIGPNAGTGKPLDARQIVIISEPRTGYKLSTVFGVNARGNNDETALIRAAREGNVQRVKELIGDGADVNIRDINGQTALTDAASNGHTDCVKALIAAQANLSAKDNNLGENALMWAASNGHAEIVKALITAHADVNLKDSLGKTALILAAEEGHADVVRTLVRAGSNLNAKDKEGNTALVNAAAQGKTATVKALISAGANLNAENQGQRALGWASTMGHDDVAAILRRAGAR
jgi:hypothetical protein